MDEEVIQGRYQVIEPIGEGGLGTVYYGWDLQLGRAIAIKRLHSTSGYRDPHSEAYQEARVMASLQHPNIVTLHDFGIDGQGAYFIMEYLQGHTLADEIKAGMMEVGSFRSLARQCLEGLAAAHEAGIIHRDIKPSNIMLLEARNAPFRVKLLDFGMARVQQAPREQSAADDGSLMGSIFYMAPEQLSRNPVDARTDLYALGHMMYHALAGDTAFHGETIMDLIHAHLNETPLPIRVHRPDLDEATGQWLMALMERDAAARPANAQAALDCLPGGVETGIVELATVPAPPPPAARPNFVLHEVQPAAAASSSGGGALWWIVGGVAALAVGVAAFFFSRGDGGSGASGSPSLPSGGAPPAVRAAEKENPEPPVQAPSRATPPVVQSPPPSSAGAAAAFAPDDLLRIGARVGEEITVEGTPVMVGQNRSRTILYLNFSEKYQEALALVFFISDQPEEFTRERLEHYLGKRIRVRGRVERYQTDLQIKIRSFEQIKVL